LRDIAHTVGTGRPAAAVAGGAAAIIAAIGLAVIAAPAAASSLPPTVTSSFTPNLIGVGGTSAIGFTVTDPNASGSFTNVSYNDALGAGGVIDNPNGENASGCGSSVVVTANPGSNAIDVSGATVKAGTPCVISIAVTSSTAETVTSQTTPVTWTGGSTKYGAAAALTVLTPPTATVASPRNNAKYRFRQRVLVSYSCAQSYYALGLEGCTAEDDLGNTIADGGLLDTNVPGSHELLVQAISASGLITDATIDYTVLPDNLFKLKGLRTKGGQIGFKLVLPGAGKVRVKAFDGRVTFAAGTFTVRGKKTIAVIVVRRPAAAALLAKGAQRIKLRVTFTPKGGVAHTVTRHFRII
jgi:hypothetical protein